MFSHRQMGVDPSLDIGHHLLLVEVVEKVVEKVVEMSLVELQGLIFRFSVFVSGFFTRPPPSC
jgi:hypothetical protein